MNVNLNSNIIQAEVYWRLLSSSLLCCISDSHAVDLPQRPFFSLLLLCILTAAVLMSQRAAELREHLFLELVLSGVEGVPCHSCPGLPLTLAALLHAARVG